MISTVRFLLLVLLLCWLLQSALGHVMTCQLAARVQYRGWHRLVFKAELPPKKNRRLPTLVGDTILRLRLVTRTAAFKTM